MNEGQSRRPAGELSDYEIRREAQGHMQLVVAREVQSRTRRECDVSEETYHAALLRLTLLRREARRRAALN
jgi:hypothetical protein